MRGRRRDIPEHWLSVGTATAPAHDVDPDYPELLAGTPLEVRDYIRHAIGHLHDMAHMAGSQSAGGRPVH